MEFLELFYDSTVVLSGAYYPTSPLVLHHILEIVSHLHAAERDHNLRNIVGPINFINIGRTYQCFIHMLSFLILELR